LRRLSRREARLVTSWVMLENWHKTPTDLGLDWDDVDPWWAEAMLEIEAGYAAGLRAKQGRS